MKVLVNSGINLSGLDGWWAEACTPEVGWALSEAVRGELYADGVDGAQPVRVEMQRVRQRVGATHGSAYRAGVPVSPPATDFTARLIPRRDSAAVPLEEAHMLWQR
jgi:glycogen phosphorylase